MTKPVYPSVDDCVFKTLQKVSRPEGDLTIVEAQRGVPFELARIYYLYDVPGGAFRGGHAHFDLEQLLVVVMGAVDVLLDDGNDRKTVRLDNASKGLYIPRMIWRELLNFSGGAVCLVLASRPYDEADYIRSHEEFLLRRGDHA